MMRMTLDQLSKESYSLEENIAHYEKRLEQIRKNHPEVQRLMTIPGIRLLGSTAIIAAVDPSYFKNGRELAAWLGLVPKQHSSGGKQELLGISKRGNSYFRSLLIHGARAKMRWLQDKRETKMEICLQKLKEQKGINKTSLALANKNARIVWTVLKN